MILHFDNKIQEGPDAQIRPLCLNRQPDINKIRTYTLRVYSKVGVRY